MVEANSAFITTDRLAELIQSLPPDKLRILNASYNFIGEINVYRDHANSRIPGARFLDLSVVRDIESPYPFMMPKKELFIAMMKALDVRKSQTVVVYDNGKGWFASRAAFMIKAFGHPQVFILDGNFAKW